MPQDQSVVLVGAGRDKRTLLARKTLKTSPRSFVIGTLRISSGKEYPVPGAFVQQHCAEIGQRLNEGALLVQVGSEVVSESSRLHALFAGAPPEAPAPPPPPEAPPAVEDDAPAGEGKPLTKAELAALCEEKGIDISDAPSAKEMRRRLAKAGEA